MWKALCEESTRDFSPCDTLHKPSRACFSIVGICFKESVTPKRLRHCSSAF